MKDQDYVTPSDLLTNLFQMIAPQKSKQKQFDFDDTNERGSQNTQNPEDNSPSDAVREESAKISVCSSSLIESIINLPAMQKYALSSHEVIAIARGWGEYLADGRGFFSARKLVCSNESTVFDPAKAVSAITSLLDRKVFRFSSAQDSDYHYNPNMILEENYEFDSWFVCALLDKDYLSIAISRFEARFSAQDYALDTYMDFLRILLDSYPELSTRVTHTPGYFYGKTLSPAFEYLGKTLESLPENTHLKMIANRFGLSVQETLMVLVVYYLERVRHSDIPTTKLLSLFAADAAGYDHLLKEMVNNPAHPIHSVLVKSESFFSSDNDMQLAESALVLINHQPAKSDSGKLEVKQLLADSAVLSILKTSQTIDSLILPAETKSILTSIVTKLEAPVENSLAQWGLIAQSLTEDAAVLNGICLLLHGHPGTGKTFAAGAIANSLGKELVNINASYLKTKWYGESQKIVRSAFVLMRKIIAETANPPVFLLNEADQLIHMRSELKHSCSEIDNAIQNIILEELETFPGILIATTNLVANLDAAYSRRFAYKVELPLPDEACRRQLWKLHLPDTIPGAKSIDIAYLAKKHSISGGQIKIIVQNACSAAIIRTGAERCLTMLDLVKYADMEDANSFEAKKKAVGFGRF